MPTAALGLDLGTQSARALVVDLATGTALGAAEAPYARGTRTDPHDPDVARQHPLDHLAAAGAAGRAALAAARGQGPVDVVGIGVDTTGSTPLPVDARLQPLAGDPRFADDPAAWAWLWKDHSAKAEAAEITGLARERRPHYLARCGGTYSSEWYWAKVLHARRVAPRVFAAAHAWLECCDFVVAWLTGAAGLAALPRSVCAAGHKGLHAPDWAGLPDAEFLAGLDPSLAGLRARLEGPFAPAGRSAGRLAAAPAAALGLAPGIPVSVGALDAHLGAVGAGIAEGDLVKVLGTSTCDMAVARLDRLPGIEGISGIVRDSIVPGLVGFEAGQSAVGDLFDWCALGLSGAGHEALQHEAARMPPGASGLLALDWHNGNRCVLVDPELSGLVVGLSLQTRPAELYRALVEATAFGARVILERLVSGGVPARRLIACGGIAQKSPLVLQVLADVLARPVLVAGAGETCALGAAICGAVAGGWFPDVTTAQRSLCPAPARAYAPDPASVPVYERLHRLYQRLHDAFGPRRGALGDVMKELLAVRALARRAT